MREDQGITLDQVEAGWMEDGGGIIGEQPDFIEEDVQEWDTQPQTISDTGGDDIIPPPANTQCLDNAGDPPGAGTWVLGSVGGICQWIDTTTCP